MPEWTASAGAGGNASSTLIGSNPYGALNYSLSAYATGGTGGGHVFSFPGPGGSANAEASAASSVLGGDVNATSEATGGTAGTGDFTYGCCIIGADGGDANAQSAADSKGAGGAANAMASAIGGGGDPLASTMELTEARRPRLQSLQQRLALGRRTRQQVPSAARAATPRRAMADLAVRPMRQPRRLAQPTALPLRSRAAGLEELAARLGPAVMEAPPLRPRARRAKRLRARPEAPAGREEGSLHPPQAREARRPLTRQAEDRRSRPQSAAMAAEGSAAPPRQAREATRRRRPIRLR